MRAIAAGALLVLLASCSEDRKRDPVVKKIDSPVKLTVRRHEVRYKPPCEEKGLDVYKCWLAKAEKTGCVYLDVGEPFDDPAHENPCENDRESRMILSSAPVPLDFELDAPGYRFAWRTGTAWQVGYLWDGKLIKPARFELPNLAMEEPKASKRPRLVGLGGLGLSGTGVVPEAKSDAPIDWRALKSFDDALPELYFQAPADAQEGMLARLRKLGGEDAVVKMLSDHFGVGPPGWDTAFESLEAPHQKKVAAAAEQQLFDDGNEDAISWFDEHPELSPKDLEPRLAERAKAAIERGDVEVTQRWLTRGYQKHDPTVGAVACELLEAEDLLNSYGQGEGGSYDATAYAVIAATHTRCPTVTRTLGSNPCDGLLRCTPSEFEANDYDLAPLCTAEDVAKVISVLRDDEDPPEEYEQAAKMGALLAQGPLPKAFALADARRSYQVLQPDAGEDDALPGPCGADPGEISRFLCQLRPEQTRFTMMGCKVEIDDEHQRVRFTPLDAPDAGR